MSKAGQRLLQGAREALEFAKGNADLDEYRVHNGSIGAADSAGTGPELNSDFTDHQDRTSSFNQKRLPSRHRRRATSVTEQNMEVAS